MPLDDIELDDVTDDDDDVTDDDDDENQVPDFVNFWNRMPPVPAPQQLRDIPLS
jgi:hypothetical protein